jgi:hypothetical protein
MERMEKQTAVEWLLENLNSEPYSEEDFEHNKRCWEQAKEMEKEQICEAYAMGVSPTLSMFRMWKCGEDYYNKTFKSE